MRALEGLRVVDLGRGGAAGFCTMNLADMGAEVIAVAAPAGAAGGRAGAPGASRGSPGGPDRGQLGLTLDLGQPAGREILGRLARAADVLVEDRLPHEAAALGLAPAALAEVNPRLVHCSVTGFGRTGPYAGREGADLVAQAMSGILSVTGEEDGPPARAGVPVAELAAGLFAAYGILCALEHRDRTGLGQHVDTSLLEAALALTTWESCEYWVTGQAPRPLGSAHRLSAPYQALRARDGHFTVGANNDKLFAAFCEAIERPDLAADPRFADRVGRLQHRADLIPAIERTTAGGTRAGWLASLDRAGVPAGPINTCAEALADPHAAARGMVVDLAGAGAGPPRALGLPVKLSATPGTAARAAARPGEHTARILTELGYAEAEQRALRDLGVT